MFLQKGRTFEIKLEFPNKNILLKNSKPSLEEKHAILRSKVLLLKPVTIFL